MSYVTCPSIVGTVDYASHRSFDVTNDLLSYAIVDIVHHASHRYFYFTPLLSYAYSWLIRAKPSSTISIGSMSTMATDGTIGILNRSLTGYRTVSSASTHTASKYLAVELDFEVVWADADNTVLYPVRGMFNIPFVQSVTIVDIDPIDMVDEGFASGTKKDKKFDDLRNRGLLSNQFDVLMVEVKYFEFGTRTGLCAPPREMITEASLGKMKALLYDYGAIIVHVIPADYVFYVDLVENIKKVFSKLYKTDLNNDTYFVLVFSSEEEEDSLKENIQSLRLLCTLEELLKV
ncbi:hypothetical protein L1987_36194 [Smallanthus sonchifolius]|uniref:Uncharacterized protein n=1 Tax=Smallanthus sonchifolius TaxID=185202 RepID=A0ACB9HCS0_9ASTR|nr:hypothetical protein L1987_36194 [Smallanthus sonchifolius]